MPDWKQSAGADAVQGIRRIASTPEMRWLSQAGLRKIGVAMRDAENDLEHPKGLAVIRLLLLVGLRP